MILMRNRVVFDVALFVLAFLAPWWLVAILAIVGLFLFRDFYEFIIISAIFYSLYLINLDKFIASPVFFVFIVFLIYLVSQIAKNYIILYKK